VHTVKGGMCGGTLRAYTQRGYVWGYTIQGVACKVDGLWLKVTNQGPGFYTCIHSEGVCAGVHYVHTLRGGMCGDTLFKVWRSGVMDYGYRLQIRARG